MTVTEGSLLHQSRESSLRSRRDSVSLVQQALSEDAEDALAHATLGFYYYLERNQRNHETIGQCVAASQKFLHHSDAQSRHYSNALASAFNGNVTQMIYHLEQQLQENPTDIIALKLCQGELFWLGEMQWSASVSAAVENEWNSAVPYYSDFLSIRAFDLEETGDHVRAEALGREAVSLNPSDVWGAHAVTHVMYMQGRSQEGARWLDDLHAGGHWQGLGQMVLHLWWHRALFYLLDKQFEKALSVYDEYLRNFEIDMVASLPDLYLDLQNAVSLLIRLELHGVSVGERWSTLAEYCLQRTTDQTNAFSCVHYAAVLAADERFEQAQALVDSMLEYAGRQNNFAASYSNAAVPAAKSVIAYRKKDYGAVVELLMPVRHRLIQMGGSHAQREVVLLILADALQRTGQSALLHNLSIDMQGSGFSDAMTSRIL